MVDDLDSLNYISPEGEILPRHNGELFHLIFNEFEGCLNIAERRR
jgi:hypothetical protein